MALKMVGIGEVGISNNPDDVIKTMALGSCVAVIFLAPKIRAAGMAHVALPDSSIGGNRAEQLKGYFADKAVPYLVEQFKKLGVEKNSDIIVKIAGGATIMDPNGVFNIGKRNILAIKKVLWKNRLAPRAEDVGDNFSRTVWIEMKTGKVFVSSPRKGVWEL
ncbi:MAG: chemoreceptor glutamine deamidase CheD [Calditrichia bacterium]